MTRPHASVNVDGAVAAARKARAAFLRHPGIVGVGHGWKIRAGKRTGEYAVVVYVRAKKPLRTLSRQERIPQLIGGARTDVLEIGDARSRLGDEREHQFINYLKAHRENRKTARGKGAPSTSNDRDICDISIIEDDPKQSFIIASRKDIDWIAAYKKFRLTHGDDYDFVTFWSDFEVNCECGAFYCGLTNPAKGINWSACMPQGRTGWGSKRLQGFMYFIRDDDAALLQEIGHHWGAFAGFKLKKTDRRASYQHCLDNQPGHWSSYFDDDASPMDYDESELRLGRGQSVDWVDNGDGSFKRKLIGQGEYRFCNLDLYLMGLLEPKNVGDFYFIRNPKKAGAKLRGERVDLNIDNILFANGQRTPTVATSPKSFTNAFILLTRDASKAEKVARKIDAIRARYTAAFAAATGNRAKVMTKLLKTLSQNDDKK